MPVVILHGWSDTSASFQSLGQWLKSNGFDVTNIWLGDYLSMNDEITLFDLGAAFQRALADNNIPQTPHSFDLIVHSTGGLVAREYLWQICDGDPSVTPVSHLLMMSPANFGSPLASLGKSVLGRLFKGWGWNHVGQTGTQILNALELASPYSWQLAESDLFNPAFKICTPAHTIVTVLAGTVAYDDPLRRTVHEDGSDGTVRVSTANLNAHYLKLNFSDPAKPTLVSMPRCFDPIAFAVFPRNHTTIHDPLQPDPNNDWANVVKCALTTDPGGYADLVAKCQTITKGTIAAGQAANEHPDWFHEYQHVVFRVKDQFGEPITDYVVEFYQEIGDQADAVFDEVHSDILEKVTTNSTDASYRSFLFDTTDLVKYIKQNANADIQMSLSAANVSDRIIYRNPKSGVDVFTNGNQQFLYPNEPVMVDVLLCRDSTRDVFKLTLE
ncbi:MAG TPA: hypothetical protein VMF08_18580 [Candidatus Sulfotelmatobacter sp.]|nr:hypothetical protein [Candidatus Sulfotelmatobacter sp.]